MCTNEQHLCKTSQPRHKHDWHVSPAATTYTFHLQIQSRTNNWHCYNGLDSQTLWPRHTNSCTCSLTLQLEGKWRLKKKSQDPKPELLTYSLMRSFNHMSQRSRSQIFVSNRHRYGHGLSFKLWSYWSCTSYTPACKHSLTTHREIGVTTIYFRLASLCTC